MQLCGGKETALGNICLGRAAIGSQLSQGRKATPTPAPVPESEATSYLSCCPSHPPPPFPPNLAAHSFWTPFLFSAGFHSSKKSPWNPQSPVSRPSESSQEIPPFYPRLFGFHQSSPLGKGERFDWPVRVQLLTGSSCSGDKAVVWMLPWNGPQDRPSVRLSRARTHLCPSCSASSSSSEGKHGGVRWLLGDPPAHSVS